MDNLVLIVYLIGKLDSILFLSWAVILGLSSLLVLRGVCRADAIGQLSYYTEGANHTSCKSKVDYWDKFGFKRYLIPSIFLMILTLATPNESSAYKIMAVYGGVELVTNPKVQALGGKGVEVLNKVMDDYIEGED